MILRSLILTAVTTMFSFGAILDLSPALTDDALSSIVNPAGLGTSRSSNFAVNSSMKPDSFMLAAISGGRFGFGVQRVDSTTSVYMSTGYRPSKKMMFGTRFGYVSKSDSESSYNFDMGLMARPSSWLSLGFSTNNLLGGIGDYSINGGVAIRPIKFLTIGATSTYLNERWSPAELSATIELDGLAFNGLYGVSDKKISAGVSVSFANTEIGYLHPVSDGGRGQRFSLWSGKDIKPALIGPRKSIAVINIEGALIDALPEFTIMGGTSGNRLSDILVQLRNAARDNDVRQVILRIGNVGAGLGMLDEIRSAIKDLKIYGKRTVACMENVDLSSYYLAVAADRIVVEPLATWVMVGLTAEVPFYKGLFDKIGVKAEFEKVGEYKSYPEVFTGDSMSTAFKENEVMLLSGWYNYLVDNIVTDRGVDRDTLVSVLDRGSIPLEEAVKKGMITSVGYYSDIVEELAGKSERTVNLLKRSYYGNDWSKGKSIAIVVIEGTIIGGESFTDIFSGESFTGSKTICNVLRKLRLDRNVKAVILRVNSPGGSGVASDQIWKEVRKIREAGKPVIASISDVAASGGYFVIADADAILAGEGSVVGSIGVFAGKFVLKGLYDKLGIKKEIINFGANADVFSDYKEFSEEQRKTLKASLNDFYQGFLKRVSDGRKITMDSANVLGRGRVFTGSQAKARGLVDEIGGLAEAIDLAKSRAKLSDDKDGVGIEVYPKPKGFWAELAEQDTKISKNILRAVKELNSQHILAVMPYRVKLK
ncbi:MAG: signal peptide peptidase SppA [Fibrobacteres bacterium]|nr:signal peptide peptidase SppA [Fibrobacterota bacterium]